MAVLKGEGRVPILFGSWALPVTPNRDAYIARPDVAGEHPTVVIAHDAAGITSGIKALARHMARHGYATLVPALDRGLGSDEGFDWAVGDLADAVISAGLPGTPWASDSKIALVGIGSGGIPAAIVAADESVPLLVLAGSSLDGQLIAETSGGLLVLHGLDDAVTPGDEVRRIQSDIGRGEWVLYSGVGAGFLDDGSSSFDPAAAADAIDRMVAAFDRTFGVVTAT
jgi:dienelactone hydrolase